MWPTQGHPQSLVLIHRCEQLKHIAQLLTLAFLFDSAVGSELADTKSSSHAKVTAIGLNEVRWTEGFWAERFATCRDRSVPAMWELMKGEKYKPFYRHFLIAAGKTEGKHRGAKWNDGDFYKWIEAACSVLAVTDDNELANTIDQCIEAIGQAQRDDGYIHTPVLIANRNGDDSIKALQDRANFEMYNMGHLITAACLHHRVTGKDNFLKIAKKTAAFLEQTFANPTPELARNSVCPSHYMAMVELYRTTQDVRYLDLAKTFLEMRNIMREGGDDNQDVGLDSTLGLTSSQGVRSDCYGITTFSLETRIVDRVQSIKFCSNRIETLPDSSEADVASNS